MHGSMNMKKDQDERERLLNKPSTDPGVDRGYELMIRNKKRRIKPKTVRTRFGKIVSLFKRGCRLIFDIRKKP